MEVEGMGMPDIRSEIVPKAGEDGSWTYTSVLEESHIILSGVYVAGDVDDAFTDMYTTWLPAFAPQVADLALQFNWPGWGAKKVMCKPLNRHFDVNRLLSLGKTNWAVEFVAEDPTILPDP
jgi:hypothetical protein